MFSEIDNDTLACIIKSNPEFEPIIQNIISDNKKTTSMFVHELRNPLSLMKGTIQYIELKHPETREFKYWTQMEELLNDMEHIMADASILNTCYSLKKEDCNLLWLIQNVVSSFMPQAYTREIELSLKVTPYEEAYFSSYSCDSGKMKQVLSNLIKNAFEATHPGNFIHIDLSHLPAQNTSPAKLSIRISNNGQPIPEDAIDSIFAPFVTNKKGGTGVGLAVVEKVIDLHYGSISVESNKDLTAFTILLPL